MWNRAESHVPLVPEAISTDIARHLHQGWNYVGVEQSTGDPGEVILQYRRTRATIEDIDGRTVARAVISHFADRTPVAGRA